VLGLALAGSADAHVDAIPAFLPASGTESLSLTVHNDIEETMTSFAVTVPPGFGVGEVGDVEGWSAAIDGRTATWAGGSLAFETAETFTLTLEAPAEPGAVTLDAEQRYPGDRSLRWPVDLTVVPADETSSSGWVWVVVAVGAGVLALAGVAILWRRRSSLQVR
jgi:hypothetical protein